MPKWPGYIRQAAKKRLAIHPFSRMALRISVQLTGCLYVLGCLAGWIAPYAADYFAAMLYQRAAFENAPATLLAGLIVACIADVVLQKQDGQS